MYRKQATPPQVLPLLLGECEVDPLWPLINVSNYAILQLAHQRRHSSFPPAPKRAQVWFPHTDNCIFTASVNFPYIAIK